MKSTRFTRYMSRERKSNTPSEGRSVARTRKRSNASHTERWVRQRRADLMAKASDAEKSAYRLLRALGYEVIRQKPISTGRRIYFADLYVPALRAVVEIDGDYHYTKNQRRLDTNRSNGLWRMGYHVLRLSNRDARNMNKIKSKMTLLMR